MHPSAGTILGLFDGTHDAGAAIIREGRVLAACNQERFTRRKGDGGWPQESLSTCLELAGIELGQVDQVAFAGVGNPNPVLRLLRPLQRRWQLDDGSFYSEDQGPSARLAAWLQFDSPFPSIRFDSRRGRALRPLLEAVLGARLGHRPPRGLRIYEHHRCHAASAWLTSGWPEALVLTADGLGDGLALTVHGAGPAGLELLGSMPHPNSYGLLYATMAGFMGFRPFRHEGKLMGLAAGGDAQQVPVEFPFQGPADGRRFTQAFGPGLQPWLAPLRACRREDVCAWLQQGVEREICALAELWMARSGLRRLAVAGGLFANVRLNQRLSQLQGLQDLHVFPHMGDGGLAVGAALLAWQLAREPSSVPPRLPHVFLGPRWSEAQLEGALQQAGLRVERPADSAQAVAELLAQGGIAGRFDGPMEYGPRALGNRSILASARQRSASDRLNRALLRSDFMPFAPIMLDDDIEDWVEDVAPVRHAASFMTVSLPARPRLRELCPGAVHLDGSLRPQLVTRQAHPWLHRLLRRYRQLTGVPALINTSFNRHEEPIVCAPHEAVATFRAAGLDLLSMGPFTTRVPRGAP